jgi:hypothetical protein
MKYCCVTFAQAVRDGEADKNYAKMGWAWPVNKAAGVLPRYVWKWCPICQCDLPPLLDDAAIQRIMDALWPHERPRCPDWLLRRRSDWLPQADGEGDETG